MITDNTVPSLLEAYDFGQFAGDANWPLAAPVRQHVRDLLDVFEVHGDIVLEYVQQYTRAQDFAALQIWASMLRHKGDPRWEYDDPRTTTGERCT